MPAGAPEGNQNAVKGALYNSALKRALARSGKTVDGGLNKVCDQLVKAALNGEQWAIKEVADRIDGKAAQTMDLKVEEKKHEELLDDLDD
jgi:hypothetical protein